MPAAYNQPHKCTGLSTACMQLLHTHWWRCTCGQTSLRTCKSLLLLLCCCCCGALSMTLNTPLCRAPLLLTVAVTKSASHCLYFVSANAHSHTPTNHQPTSTLLLATTAAASLLFLLLLLLLAALSSCCCRCHCEQTRMPRYCCC